MDNVQRETHVVSAMTQWPLETVALARDAKDGRLLPHQIRWPRLMKEETNPRKHQVTERKILQTKGAKFRAVIFLKQKTVM